MWKGKGKPIRAPLTLSGRDRNFAESLERPRPQFTGQRAGKETAPQRKSPLVLWKVPLEISGILLSICVYGSHQRLWKETAKRI